MKGGFELFTAGNYVVAKSLEEAYQLNQKKTAGILGGMLWMRTGKRRYSTLIDLSALGLDGIKETENEFVIGAMVPLRELETNETLRTYYGDAFLEAVRHIVGTQFRHMATVGGSLFGRYGFSDVATIFLALDCTVELYHAGEVPIETFLAQKPDRDVLVAVHLKKTPCKVCYQSQRITETDFPVLTCAVSRQESGWVFAIGARPSIAKRIENTLPYAPTADEIAAFVAHADETLSFDSNMRGSEEYRRHLTRVFVRRAIGQLMEETR